MPLICTCDHYNLEHTDVVGRCMKSGCSCDHFVSPTNQAMHLDPDEVTMGHWARREGTVADISNGISDVISDVFRTYDPGVHVPWSIRYGIASEIQRRLNVTKKEE